VGGQSAGDHSKKGYSMRAPTRGALLLPLLLCSSPLCRGADSLLGVKLLINQNYRKIMVQ
jgi:hypothetical protein